MYIPGDNATSGVAEDLTIYECWDVAFCGNVPSKDESTLGWWGWGDTGFVTSDLNGYNAASCATTWHYVDMTTNGYLEYGQYKMGDVIVHDADGPSVLDVNNACESGCNAAEFYICGSTFPCRLTTGAGMATTGVFTEASGWSAACTDCNGAAWVSL